MPLLHERICNCFARFGLDEEEEKKEKSARLKVTGLCLKKLKLFKMFLNKK